MNTSCHTFKRFMSHGTRSSRSKWVLSHMNESCMNESYHINQSCHIWIRHVTHLNESCHRGHAVLDLNGYYHVWKSHIAYRWVISHMNNSWHVYERVMSLRTRSPVSKRVMSHINESCHTGVMLRMNAWRSQVTHIHESCHRELAVLYLYESCHTWMSHVTCEGVMSRMNEWRSHVTHIHESCHRGPAVLYLYESYHT